VIVLNTNPQEVVKAYHHVIFGTDASETVYDASNLSDNLRERCMYEVWQDEESIVMNQIHIREGEQVISKSSDKNKLVKKWVDDGGNVVVMFVAIPSILWSIHLDEFFTISRSRGIKHGHHDHHLLSYVPDGAELVPNTLVIYRTGVEWGLLLVTTIYVDGNRVAGVSKTQHSKDSLTRLNAGHLLWPLTSFTGKQVKLIDPSPIETRQGNLRFSVTVEEPVLPISANDFLQTVAWQSCGIRGCIFIEGFVYLALLEDNGLAPVNAGMVSLPDKRNIRGPTNQATLQRPQVQPIRTLAPGAGKVIAYSDLDKTAFAVVAMLLPWQLSKKKCNSILLPVINSLLNNEQPTKRALAQVAAAGELKNSLVKSLNQLGYGVQRKSPRICSCKVMCGSKKTWRLLQVKYSSEDEVNDCLQISHTSCGQALPRMLLFTFVKDRGGKPFLLPAVILLDKEPFVLTSTAFTNNDLIFMNPHTGRWRTRIGNLDARSPETLGYCWSMGPEFGMQWAVSSDKQTEPGSTVPSAVAAVYFKLSSFERTAFMNTLKYLPSTNNHCKLPSFGEIHATNAQVVAALSHGTVTGSRDRKRGKRSPIVERYCKLLRECSSETVIFGPLGGKKDFDVLVENCPNMKSARVTNSTKRICLLSGGSIVGSMDTCTVIRVDPMTAIMYGVGKGDGSNNPIAKKFLTWLIAEKALTNKKWTDVAIQKIPLIRPASVDASIANLVALTNFTISGNDTFEVPKQAGQAKGMLLQRAGVEHVLWCVQWNTLLLFAPGASTNSDSDSE